VSVLWVHEKNLCSVWSPCEMKVLRGRLRSVYSSRKTSLVTGSFGDTAHVRTGEHSLLTEFILYSLWRHYEWNCTLMCLLYVVVCIYYWKQQPPPPPPSHPTSSLAQNLAVKPVLNNYRFSCHRYSISFSMSFTYTERLFVSCSSDRPFLWRVWLTGACDLATFAGEKVPKM
jgi:hypothetical protein